MQVITRVVSVPANSTSLNLIAGETAEFLAGPSTVNIFARAAAVDLDLLFQVGNEVFLQNQEVAAIAGFPTKNENGLVQGVGGRGERIFVTATNRSGAAIIVQLLIEINRVG